VVATHVDGGEAGSLLSRRAAVHLRASSPEVAERIMRRRHRIGALRRTVMVADVLVTLLGVALLRHHLLMALTVLAVCVAVLAHVFAADSPRTVASVRPVLRSTLGLVGALCVLIAFLGRGSGRDVVVGAAVAGVALTGVRLAVRMPGVADRFGLGRRRRLIVGDPRALESTAARRAPAVESGEVMLVVTRADRSDPGSFAGEREQRRGSDDVRGPSGVVERVVRTALENSVERVSVIPGDSWQQPQLRELSWLLEGTGIDMVISTTLDGIAPHRVDVVQQDGRLMIKVGSASPRGTHALVKAAVDRAAAAVLLVLLAPVLVLIALAIRLDSPGAAIFRQRRVREGGATFTMYKFRTMHVDAELALSGLQELNKHGASRPLFKMEEDPRITRVGHLLRKTSLDELPQLVNVLQGRMSLIGPRPALPLEVEMYDFVARRRLAVKPGMTGLWQVSGRSRLSWEQSIGFDLDYVDNWSPAADAVIAMRTFRAVVTKDGAY
jgi:exopolysaccharide biosynthesis polyprenyl glycosylphosphotransferase